MQTCLFLFDLLTHPNIKRLIDFYTFCKRHNFLFYAYEKNLRFLFNDEVWFGAFPWDITFFLAICRLALALCNTHRHHLKNDKRDLDKDTIRYHHHSWPANVLVSPKTFILADLQLEKFKPKDILSQMQ